MYRMWGEEGVGNPLKLRHSHPKVGLVLHDTTVQLPSLHISTTLKLWKHDKMYYNHHHSCQLIVHSLRLLECKEVRVLGY
jgi:hypothetical protein